MSVHGENSKLAAIVREWPVEPGAIAAYRAAFDQMREALQEIRQACIDGHVCDDVAWFSGIETLYDRCGRALSAAAEADGLRSGAVSAPCSPSSECAPRDP